MQCWILVMLQLVCTQCIAADGTIERLFFTQEQREALDQSREVGQYGLNAEPSVKQAVRSSISEPDNLVMHGYVRRSDVKQSTVWVNGKAVQQNPRGAFE